MKELIKQFRRGWQPPREASVQLEHRQVSFLELFYDLVYVVLISTLTHAFSSHISLPSLLHFIFLFIIVWWAWINGSLYHDLHGNNDLRTRVFTFLQMLTVVFMAIFAPEAMGRSSAGFALSYAFFQLILTILWWRTGVHDPKHRVLSRPYSRVFLINTILFSASVLFPMPWRYYLWSLALLLSLLLPALLFRLSKKNPAAKTQLEIGLDASPALVERFGLFTLIVLGEVVVGVVASGSRQPIQWPLIEAIILGTIIAIGIWVIYFDFISHRKPHSKTIFLWYYLHLPLIIGMAAVGGSLRNIIAAAGMSLPNQIHWLLAISLAVVMICVGRLIQIVQQNKNHLHAYRTTSYMLYISAILMSTTGFIRFSSTALLAISIVLLFAPVFLGFIYDLKYSENVSG